MVDYISITSECKRLARNVVTADFSDAQIIEYQKKEYSYIRTITDKDDWDSGDREFGAIQLVETRLVASDIIQHYGDVETIPIWQAMRADAIAMLVGKNGIVENMDTEVPEAAEAEVDRTEFKSWYLNPAKSAPDRLNSGAVDTESF
jgi:hypothetical protein